MSTDQPTMRPNLMHLGKSSDCGCGHGEGGCACGGHGRASRDYVTIEPIEDTAATPPEGAA